MVITENSQLSRECNAWREELRSQREKFTESKMRLRDLARRQTHSDVLTEIEHLDNQFYIQLINIHDLKQAIKRHDKQIMDERKASNGLVSDSTLANHEHLFEDYQRLENTLHGIRQEFNYFERQF